MTNYPQGHDGYRGRDGQYDDREFMTSKEANKRRINKSVVMLGAMVLAFVGAGVAYSQGWLDGLIDTVKKNEIVQWFVNDEPEDLRVKAKKPERVREFSLDPVETKALQTPTNADDMVGMFRFIDSKGVVHIVDHYSEIPKRYRKKAVRLEL